VIVLWCGPISASTLEKAPWIGPPPRVLTFNQGIGGVGSSHFSALAGQLAGQGGGSVLRGALKAKGLPPDTDEPVMVTGFSAAHGMIEPLLRNEDDASRVVAVGSFDAYYTGPDKTPKPGYQHFAYRASRGLCRMVMTSSHIAGPTYPSGAAAAAPLLASLALEEAPRVNVGKAICDAASARGNLAWYVYADRTDLDGAGPNLRASHVQHATILAPYFAPKLASGAELATSSFGGFGFGEFVAGLFVGAAAGAFA
jgi:hypothetical protein